MGQISTSDARGLFTKMLVAVYKERTTPTSFLRSFFEVKETSTKELSIAVQRGTEKIAVDVERGTEGNRNSFSKSNEKIFVPPYYREYFDNNDLDLYDRLFASEGTIDDGVFTDFLNEVADKYRMLQDKIERAYEKNCADVLQTGIVQLNAGTNIDFKRKAASLVDLGAGNYWADAGIDPITTLEAGCKFIRQEGKAQGSMFNAIMGSGAINDFLSNDKVQARADVRNFQLDAIRAPQRNSVGASLHGVVSAGSYNVALWSYPEYYDNAAGASTPYIDDKNLIILPERPNFKLGFAAVPQILKGNRPVVSKGAYIMGDYIDPRNDKHVFDMKSAGVPIPVGIDQIYTAQVKA